MDFQQELGALMSAGASLIQVTTFEEDRLIRLVCDLARKRQEPLGVMAWDVADGFQELVPGNPAFATKEIAADVLLHYVADKMPERHILILKDFHHNWRRDRAKVTRKLRNMTGTLRRGNRHILFVSPPLPREEDSPLELKDELVSLEMPLPSQDELDGLFQNVTSQLDEAQLPRPEVREKLIQSALGLTSGQARFAFSRVWAKYRKFDERGIDDVTAIKRRIIKESGALEFWPATLGEAHVGGLDLLKAWIQKREVAIHREARDHGLKFPRGLMMIGIPGTGKSLTAKMISGVWKLPLLRLDVGALFGSLLGESEQNIRQAIMLAETVSPCILWLDEVEKAFAGSGPSSLNSGAATRLFGAFLTWMQEHESPVFVVATANEVQGLPPELIGRFDQMFFLDLPNREELAAIFEIHLKNVGVIYPSRQFDMNELIERSQGMVGREIERAIREAQFTAYADQNREIEQEDLTRALKAIIPLSASHAEVIEQLRRWKTEGRATAASSEEVRAEKRGRDIQV